MKRKKITRRKGSYNPFKMFGSWIGFSLFGGIPLLGTIVKGDAFNSVKSCSGGSIYGSFCISNQQTTIILIVTSIIGFLVGWGIHSLVRKLR